MNEQNTPSELSDRSRRTIRRCRIFLFFYGVMAAVLLFEFVRSAIAYHDGTINLFHFLRVNTYLIGTIFISPVILSETRYLLWKAKNNEM